MYIVNLANVNGILEGQLYHYIDYKPRNLSAMAVW